MNREAFEKVLVSPDDTIRRVIEAIDAGGLEIALVVDRAGRLVGTVTDGDVRRALLRGAPLEEHADRVMNAAPRVASPTATRDYLLAVMQQHGIKQVPLVDAEGRLVGLEVWREVIAPQPARPNPVVLLAGGFGQRLRPLTDKTPKPLLPVGSRPLIETIVEQLRQQGFREIHVSVNYKADLIRAHLRDGAHLGVHIDYIEEKEPLGTAGPLKVAQRALGRPFLVVNGDLLTKVNFGLFLDYHLDGRFDLTMGVKQYDFKVPYGVVTFDQDRVLALREKPTHSFFVNAGLYALTPTVLDLVPAGKRYDMTELIERLLLDKRPVGGFPIHEYWLDVGGPQEYARANDDFPRIFQELNH